MTFPPLLSPVGVGSIVRNVCDLLCFCDGGLLDVAPIHYLVDEPEMVVCAKPAHRKEVESDAKLEE